MDRVRLQLSKTPFSKRPILPKNYWLVDESPFSRSMKNELKKQTETEGHASESFN